MPRNTDTVPYVVKHCVENADHVRIKDRQAALGKAWLAQERLAWTCRAMTSHCNHASGCAFASEKMAISSCSASLPNSSDLSIFKTYNSLYHSQQHDVARYLTQFPRSSTSVSCCTAHDRLWGSGIQIQSLKRVIFKRHLQDVR